MSPLRVLEWAGVSFVILLLVLLIALGVRFMIGSPPCPDPAAHENDDEGRTVEL